MAARAGTTLIECFVALFILAIGLLGAGATLATADRIDDEARRRLRYSSMAMEEIDRFSTGPCPTGDSTWQWSGASDESLRWERTRQEAWVRLTFVRRGPDLGVLWRQPLQVRRRCP